MSATIVDPDYGMTPEERALSEGEDQGYLAGWEEGHAAGRSAGKEEGAAAERDRLIELAEGMGAEVARDPHRFHFIHAKEFTEPAGVVALREFLRRAKEEA